MNAPGNEVVPGLRGWAHRYVSTVCRHHPHVAAARCRNTCKFCAAPCRCYCHTSGRWYRNPLKAAAYVLRRAYNRTVTAGR